MESPRRLEKPIAPRIEILISLPDNSGTFYRRSGANDKILAEETKGRKVFVKPPTVFKQFYSVLPALG
jgi:hypothetical protein